MRCSAALRRDSSVFSTDRDFEAYERILQLRRHHVDGWHLVQHQKKGGSATAGGLNSARTGS
jgi:hypothetical protein